MRPSALPAFLVGILLALASCAPPVPPAWARLPPDDLALCQQELADFDAMVAQIRAHYPFLEVNKRKHGIDWLSLAQELRHQFITVPVDPYTLPPMGLCRTSLDALHNGHTHLADRNMVETYGSLLLRPDIPLREYYEQIFANAAVQRYYQLDNATIQAWKAPVPSVADMDDMTPTADVSSACKATIGTEILVPGSAALLRLPTFTASIPDNQANRQAIRSFLFRVRDWPLLLVDIRGNSGGGDGFWRRDLVPLLIRQPASTSNYFLFRNYPGLKPYLNQKFPPTADSPEQFRPMDQFPRTLPELDYGLVQGFSHYYQGDISIEPDPEFSFGGKVYLLVDHTVFSASESFASFVKNTGIATLAGERTGGDGIGIEPILFPLPSGRLLRHSLDMGITANGSINELDQTIPDIIFDAAIASDWQQDALIQHILKRESSLVSRAQ